MTADATFALEHTEEGAGCYGWRLQAVSWPSGGARRASEVVASPQCRPFRGRFVAQKRARKRGNLSIIDNVRTNAQQHTQHAQDTPQNDSCGQLQTKCDCPAVFSASSVRAGGQRRPFRDSWRFVRACAMVIASHHANVACGATRLPWLPVRSSSSPRARWNRLEQAEQAAPPAARRGAERDRGIAFVRAAAPCCQRASLRR